MEQSTSATSTSSLLSSSPDSVAISILIPAPTDPNAGVHDEIERKIMEIDAFHSSHPVELEFLPEEQVRYANNREFVKRTASITKIRNLVLLEIWERGQWRYEFGNINEFAEQVAGLSKSQLYKCLDDAKVLRHFGRRGLTNVAPHARFIEQIVKIPEAHWIPAWRYTLEATKADGLTTSNSECALHDYSRDHQIAFGRRQPNCSSLTAVACFSETHSGDGLLGEIVPEIQKPKQARQECLSVEEKGILCRGVSAKVLHEVKSCFTTKDPSEVIASGILRNIPEADLSDVDRQDLQELLRFLQSKHPDVLQRLAPHLLKVIRNIIEKTILKCCKKNIDAKNAYHRKKKKPSPSTL